MRVAAIDIGTNSLHMIVARVRPDLSFEVIDREKEMVRLGAGGLGGRALSADATAAALRVLSKFSRLAEAHQVDEIVAVATSATREAENGGEFLATIARQTGIRPCVISGTEEARLIHAAAVYGVGASTEALVVVDIGGGSVEVTRGTGTQTDFTRSYKLGVIRLSEGFAKSDPLSSRDERRLVKHISGELGKDLAAIARAGFGRLIGTSGTILSLGAVAASEEGRSPDAPLRNYRVPAKQLRRIRERLVGLDLEKRLRVPGLEPRRADLAAVGAVLLDTIISRLGAREITLCDLSLREGLILNYIAQHRKQIAQVDQYPDLRRRSVIEVAERCNYWSEHAHQVARLALLLFDATRAMQALGDSEREWLEYAALLHDVGVHISYDHHHKHSYYLIKNGDLRGFEPDEIETIALIARYHRRAEPKRRHPGFADLAAPRREAVRILSAILRIAESLDRSHSQSVEAIELTDRGDDILLRLRISGDAELELWAAGRQTGPFERFLGKPVRLEVGGQTYAQHPDHPARVPGKGLGRRRNRRLGQDVATRTQGEMADGRRAPDLRRRLELVRAREGGR